MSNQYRKKPVVIQAFQFQQPTSVDEAPEWLIEAVRQDRFLVVDGVAHITTLEGVMTAQPGDWIICGVKGELHPCKPDIFAATYEEAATPAEQPAPASTGREPSVRELTAREPLSLEDVRAHLSQPAPAAPALDVEGSTGRVKDHVLREVVNNLRDIAVKFHAAGQLRERLRGALDPLLAPGRTGTEVRPLGRAAQTGQPELFSHAVDETSVRVAWPDGSVRLYIAARELDVEAERREFEAYVASCQSPFIAGEEWSSLEIKKAWLVWLAARSAAQGTQPESAPVSTEQAGDAPGEGG